MTERPGCCAPHLQLLDTFELSDQRRPVQVPRPAQRLLAYLALRGRPVGRRAAAAALWADLPERQGLARLRSTLWRLPTVTESQLVLTRQSGLSLTPELEVDVRLAQDESHLDELDVGRLSSDVLPDWEDDWVSVERERFRQVRLHLLERLAQRASERRHYDRALQAALTAVASDPLRESAHRQVMTIHLAEQNPAEALRQYEACRRVLRTELGLAPSPATRAVVEGFLGRPLDMAAGGRARRG
ncbi:MAG TPA: BTAD domain-containing putative transcriptional regulator [Jatrophihabitans sp.]|jgi:DNA-binding SARP family transcriptional activator|uniref:AfsR/SARP family transcriptional regulator n=1 Tax=Jatrophihabitans sp. TaxID=1932789 RepID=UPI002F14BEA2